MVTNEEYLKALETIKQYKEQIRKKYEDIRKEEQKAHNNLSGLGLKVGDYITYIGGSKSKYLTKGVKYKIHRDVDCEWNMRKGRVAVKNDNKKPVTLSQRCFVADLTNE